MGPLRNRFLAGKLEEKDFSYVGFRLKQDAEKIILDQNDYVDNVEIEKVAVKKGDSKDSLVGKEITAYRSLLGSVNWIVRGSRPDMAFELIELSTMNNNATQHDLNRVKKMMRRLKEDSSHLVFSRLGEAEEWKLYVFTDASLANLSDGIGSTMGIIVFLVNRDRVCAVSWRANKIKRVVKSTLAAESMALLEGLEEAMYIKAILLELDDKMDTPITAIVDNRSLVDSLHSTKQVSDRRLRIDMGCIKQMIQDNGIEVRWCSGSMQLANALTKRGASGKELLSVLQNGRTEGYF